MKYIGTISNCKLDKNQTPIANITPGWTETGEVLSDHERERLFPDRGRVFWFRAQPDCNDRLVLFEPVEQEIHKEGQDKYICKDGAELLLQAVDLKGYGDMARLGSLLQPGNGLHLVLRGNDQQVRVFIGCSDGWVGPVDLLANQGSYHLDPTQARLDRLNWYARQPGHLPLVQLGNGWPAVFLPHQAPIVAGQVDWRQDKDVFKAFLKLVQKSGLESGQVLSRNAIRDIAEEYFTSGLQTGEQALDRFRVDRVRTLLRAEAQFDRVIAEVQTELMHLPALVALRDQAAETGRQEGLAQATKDAESILADVHQQTEQVRGALVEQQHFLETARNEIQIEAGRRQEQVAQLEVAEKAFRQRMEDLMAEPARVLAEVALLKPFLQAPSAIATPAPHAIDANLPWPTCDLEYENLTDLWNAMEDVRLPIPLAKSFLAAFAAGLIPILYGPHSAEALARFARIAFGGRHFKTMVSPAMLEPTDLFGGLDPGRGAFLPHRSHTLDWMRGADSVNKPALLVLEGANRAPSESFLLPLMEVARTHGTLHLYHPGALVGSASPYNPKFTWPLSVFMAVCLVEGPTTLPLSSSLWTQSVLIDTRSFLPLPPIEDHGLSEVEDVYLHLDNPSCSDFKLVFEGNLPVSGDPLFPFLPTLEHYGQALFEMGFEKKGVWAHVATGLFLPASLSLGSPIPFEPRPGDRDLLAAAESAQRRVIL